MQNDKLMTIKDASTYLGLSRSTLYRLIADQEIRLIKVYNKSFVARVDLDHYLNRLLL